MTWTITNDGFLEYQLPEWTVQIAPFDPVNKKYETHVYGPQGIHREGHYKLLDYAKARSLAYIKKTVKKWGTNRIVPETMEATTTNEG